MSFESDLHDLLEETADRFEPDPAVLADAEQRAERLWRARRWTRGLTAVAAVAVAAGIVLIIGSDPTPLVIGPGPAVSPSSTPVGPDGSGVGQPEPPGSVADVPDGWQRVEAHDLAVSVPDEWKVIVITTGSDCTTPADRPAIVLLAELVEGCTFEPSADAPPLVVIEPTGRAPATTGNWRLADLIISTHLDGTGDRITLTAFVPTHEETIRVRTSAGGGGDYGRLHDVLMSIRPADQPACTGQPCRPPEEAAQPARIDITSQNGRRVRATVVNETDQPLEGGAEYSLQRWDGTDWQRYDVSDGTWRMIGQIIPPGTGGAFHPGSGANAPFELPPVAGWWRLAKPMTNGDNGALTLVSEPIEIAPQP